MFETTKYLMHGIQVMWILSIKKNNNKNRQKEFFKNVLLFECLSRKSLYFYTHFSDFMFRFSNGIFENVYLCFLHLKHTVGIC